MSRLRIMSAAAICATAMVGPAAALTSSQTTLFSGNLFVVDTTVGDGTATTTGTFTSDPVTNFDESLGELTGVTVELSVPQLVTLELTSSGQTASGSGSIDSGVFLNTTGDPVEIGTAADRGTIRCTKPNDLLPCRTVGRFGPLESGFATFTSEEWRALTGTGDVTFDLVAELSSDLTASDGEGELMSTLSFPPNPDFPEVLVSYDYEEVSVPPSAVPLPAAGFLLLGALGSLAVMRRRQQAG